MRAQDLMTGSVVTVQRDAPAKEAARLLATHGFTALPVVDARGDLVGVVTEADLIRDRILPDPRALITDRPPAAQEQAADRVEGAMTADPVVVAPATDAVVVTRLMLERHLRALPVVDGTRLVGIITRRDLLRTIARDDHDIARDVRSRLALVSRRSWLVEVDDGVVRLGADGADPEERHVVEVVAAALPGVRAVNVLGPDRADPR